MLLLLWSSLSGGISTGGEVRRTRSLCVTPTPVAATKRRECQKERSCERVIDKDVLPVHWVPIKVDRERDGEAGGGLSGSEREELARLRRQKAEMAREHARRKAEWDKQKAELETERDVLKRSVAGWVKDSMNQ